MVFLVGAGPGDPGLVTVKALDLLRKADVVLYDRLTDQELLLETRPDCILVDVGKQAGSHTKTQDEINDLIVSYGTQHSVVVRLKGGDPFLFGRGAEEAARLRREGIPFAVVPGVSALNAVPAYAGIPLTHRDYSSSLGVATGHGAQGKKEDPVRWRRLAESVDTIVVFMGVGNIASITREIQAGGVSPDTPAALIEKGTTPLQRTVTAPLEDIAAAADREKVIPPALLIVGKTVSLAEQLHWYEPGPLSGLRIGVTRPKHQSRSFTETLRAWDAHPVLMPTIETVDTIDTHEVSRVLDTLGKYEYLVFSSANGIDSFFRALKKRRTDSRALAGKKIAAIGPVTGDALSNYGIVPDITATSFIAEGLLEAILSHGTIAGVSFLIVRSDRGRTTLPDGLREAGALVDQAAFYSTRTTTLQPYVLDRLREGSIDIITFTSSSTVEGLFSQIAPGDLADTVRYASIGPQTSLALRQFGLTPDIEAEEYTTAGLAEAIKQTVCGI